MTRLFVLLLLALCIVSCSTQPAQSSGFSTVDVPGGCALWLFDETSHVQEKAVALACPGHELMRIYPLPVVQPWDESPSFGPMPTPTSTPLPPRNKVAQAHRPLSAGERGLFD